MSLVILGYSERETVRIDNGSNFELGCEMFKLLGGTERYISCN